MNKGELIAAVADKIQCTKKQAEMIITAAFEEILNQVAQGEKVTLVGFGTWEVRTRAEREGRNPRSGEKMTIPATKVPAFAPGKLFKEKVSPDA